MSLAADTRRAVRRNPFVHEALRAGVLNYTAAARFLDVTETDVDVAETDAVVAALRRYAEDLQEREASSRKARVTMQTGLGLRDGRNEDALLAVRGTALVAGDGSLTGVLATGEVDAAALAHVLDRLLTADITVAAAGVADGALVVVVGRRNGPDVVRTVEDALSAVPLTGSTD